jgi:hypothetical protein
MCTVKSRPFFSSARPTAQGSASQVSLPSETKDHRRRLAPVVQLLGGVLHRSRQRRHAARGQGADLPAQRLAIGADLGQRLDVGAVRLAAMPVGHQAQPLLRGKLVGQRLDHVLGNDDLVDAVDLPPHRPGGIQHQQAVAGCFPGRGCRLCRQSGQRERGNGAANPQRETRSIFQ